MSACRANAVLIAASSTPLQPLPHRLLASRSRRPRGQHRRRCGTMSSKTGRDVVRMSSEKPPDVVRKSGQCRQNATGTWVYLVVFTRLLPSASPEIVVKSRQNSANPMT
jgi:hypothetical protein